MCDRVLDAVGITHDAYILAVIAGLGASRVEAQSMLSQ